MKELLKIPNNYQRVMPYLIIPRAADFILFMERVFGAEQTHKHMRSDEKIMHAEIMIGPSTIMFADSTDMYPPRPGGMFIYVEDAETTYAKALAEGAKTVSPLSAQPYGKSGGVIDPFGNTWWITQPL
jgi:PhnB protein